MAGTLGLDAASFLPKFASDANRRLDAHISQLKRQLRGLESSLLDHTDTISVLKEHVGRAQKDVIIASLKLAENSKAFAQEEHLYQLDTRTLVKIHSLSDAIARDVHA